jgi:hypothetical protein
MLAAYGYDWWLKTENFEVDYARQLQDMAKGFERLRQGIAAEAAQRAKREWQLTKPFVDYAGTYKNDMLGTIEIIAKEKARLGNMNTVATPYTQPDTIRVVMEPGGNGDVISFSKDASDPNGKIGSLTYGGVTFTRVAK